MDPDYDDWSLSKTSVSKEEELLTKIKSEVLTGSTRDTWTYEHKHGKDTYDGINQSQVSGIIIGRISEDFE